MFALEGKIKNNAVVTESDISAYDGDTVIITILDKPLLSHKHIDLDKYSKRTERGQHVEEYMKEMREDDRI